MLRGPEVSTFANTMGRQQQQQRRRRRNRQHPPNPFNGDGDGGGNHHSIHTYRSIFIITLTFLAVIGFVVLITWVNSGDSSDPSTTRSKHQIHRLYFNPNDIPLNVLASLDAILVLGGGLPESLEKPPVYVQQRADDAVVVVQRTMELWKNQTAISRLSQKNRRRHIQRKHNKDDSQLQISPSELPSILCLSAGTAHLPQLLGPDGLPIWESTSCAAYLYEHGITNQTNVYVETSSYDTIGNAYFARTTHTDRNGWRNLLIITNEFHMERTMAIFDWIFLQCQDDNTRIDMYYQLAYLQSPNIGLTQEAIQARKEREASSLTSLQTKIIPKYSGTLQKVWYFLMHEHSLYTANKLVPRGKVVANDKASLMVQKSYGGGSAAGN